MSQDKVEANTNKETKVKSKSQQRRSGCPCGYGICDECKGQGRFEPRT